MARSVEQKWRNRYSKVSSRLRAQIRALEKRYPESVALEQGRVQDWGGVKTLPKDYSLAELKRLTHYAEKTLKSGLYSLQRHRRAYSNAQRTFMEDYGLKFDQKEIGAYFRFRDDVYTRFVGALPYKRSLMPFKTGNLYIQAKKKGLTKEELKANIERWAKEYEDAVESGKSETYRPKVKKSSSSKSFGSGKR